MTDSPSNKASLQRSGEKLADSADKAHALVRVSIGLLPGRTEEVKARLTEATLELLGKYIAPQDGVTLHASAEVRELDASYRKFDR